MIVIDSRKNKKLRYFRDLARERELRYAEKKYIGESVKLLREAIRSNVEIEAVLWEKSAWKQFSSEFESVLTSKKIEIYCTDGEIFEYAATLKSPEGAMFICKMNKSIDDDRIPKNVIALEDVQDPGNVGTVIRSADAFGIDTVWLIGATCDIYNPKTVRASMGSLFRVNVKQSELDVFCSEMKRMNIKTYATALSDTAKDILDADISNCAVIIGNEGKGISKAALDASDGCLIIPMKGNAESLNAAVASSIVMWEMSRR